MDYSDKVKRKINPREKANIFSLLSFVYAGELFVKAYKNDLEEDDLYEVVKSCESKTCCDKLETEFYAQKKKNKRFSMARLLWKCYGKRYILLGCVHLLWKLINSIFAPMAIGKLVKYFKPNQKDLTKNDAIFYAGIMIGLKLLHCFYFQNYFIYLQQLAIQIRTAFCSLVYRKSLKLTPSAMSEIKLGNVITIITKDIMQFERSIWLFHEIWIALVQTVVTFYLIYAKIGLASIVGVGIQLAAVPLQMYMGNKIKNMRNYINQKSDERLQLIQEALSAIRIIKMYTWERFFESRIDKARKMEIKTMMKAVYLKIVIVTASVLCSRFGLYSSIMLYIWLNEETDAEVFYYVMTCFETLRYAFAFSIPIGLVRFAELTASVNRINIVLNAKELRETPETPCADPKINLEKITLTLANKAILKNISLCFEKGLNIITGHLASGKSSLVKVILEDFSVNSGLVEVKGRKSYASQEPWLFPSSIRQNIIFGQKYNEEKYQEVTRICALHYDFGLFEKGDETIVTDRGLNLSKGQQARINLARAVYRESDIYLFDDCLSALDSGVQESIFNDCIRGYLKDKLVILVTHSANQIEQADKIVVMDDGILKCQGKNMDISKEILAAIEEDDTVKDDKYVEDTLNDATDESKPLLEDCKVQKKQIYHEVKKKGTVYLGAYVKYFKYGGRWIFLVFILAMFISIQFADSYSQKLLTNWINLQKNNSFNVTDEDDLNRKKDSTLHMYTVMILSSAVLDLINQYLVLKFARNASENIHRNMVSNIVHSVMTLFDNYYIGNILNRFSQDLSIIDEHLPFSLDMLLEAFITVGGMVILIAGVNWIFLYPSLFFIIVVLLVRHFYMPAARSLKRLESATRSPLVGHLNASMEGMSSIRACRAQNILKDEFDKHQNVYTSAYYTSLCSKRAFAFYMDVYSMMFVSIIIGIFLFFDVGTLAGNVGLAITQASGLTMVVQWCLMEWSDTEQQMTSFERVLEYTKLPKENCSGLECLKNWPSRGEINYVNVCLNYGKEPVLKNVTFTCKSQEKIGIVGRTGAGKSSIISTLFRLYNYSGQIYIDDVETKTLTLDFLRKNISIIPQDPVLFSGTMRSNIDPANEYEDKAIWRVLNKVGIEHLVTSLDVNISDNCSKFSTGQRQLICLARTIIRKNKIVVLDEATANMDPDTEFLIQKTIIENFSDCTVFIIAHRLQSILDCHKIMVLDKGEIVEFNDPLTLIENKESLFSKMLKRTGLNLKNK